MITGGCLCGAVRYRIASDPITTRICWCRLCQYLAAGSGTVNAVFATGSVVIEGEMNDHVAVADSGARMHRRFCPACGTPIASNAESRPHLTVIRVGTLDDPNLAPPAAVVWTDAAPRWACIDADLPRFTGQPPPMG